MIGAADAVEVGGAFGTVVAEFALGAAIIGAVAGRIRNVGSASVAIGTYVVCIVQRVTGNA
jgi:hypothetical protein